VAPTGIGAGGASGVDHQGDGPQDVRPGNGQGHNGDGSVIGRLSDARRYEAVLAKLTTLAWRRYRIPIGEAEDIAQTAVTTYCEVRERYADEENQFGILYGIFRKKCLEFIDRSVRELRRLRECCRTPDAARVNPRLDPEGHGSTRPVLEDLIKREDVAIILAALDELRPEAAEMLRLLLAEDVGRQGLLERYDINPNTLDWRLHTYRNEFRKLLRRKGVLG
jgi:DNA-directed RNA polymerase specialized sigma24 family protein